MIPCQGQSLEEVIRENIKGLNPFFLKSLIICNGNLQLLPETYWKEMTTRCPSEYRDDRPKPLGENSMWGSTRPENQNNVYNRGYRYSLKKWEDILNKLRLNPMADGIDFSRLIPFLFKFTKNARDCGFQSEDILPLEYIGKAKNIIRRNSDWVKCLTKQKGFHGMLEYFIKYIGEVPHHVHVVGCFDNVRQSLNGESFVATMFEGSDSEGNPRTDFSAQDGTSFNVAPCGHFGLVRMHTEPLKQWKLGNINLENSTHQNWQQFADKQRTASKKLKDGIVDEHDPHLINWKNVGQNPGQAEVLNREAFTDRIKSSSETWQEGIRDPINNPQHKNWMKAGTSEQSTINYKKQFEKQVEDWVKEKHLKYGATSKKTKSWMIRIRKRSEGKLNPLTDGEYQLLLKYNFPFHGVRHDLWNSEYKRLQEFQKKNGPKSIPKAAKGHEYESLYSWCTTQKRNAKKNKLSAERLFKLESVLDLTPAPAKKYRQAQICTSKNIS